VVVDVETKSCCRSVMFRPVLAFCSPRYLCRKDQRSSPKQEERRFNKMRNPCYCRLETRQGVVVSCSPLIFIYSVEKKQSSSPKQEEHRLDKSRKVSILLQVRHVSVSCGVLLTSKIYILSGEEVEGELLAVHLDKTKGLLLSRKNFIPVKTSNKPYRSRTR